MAFLQGWYPLHWLIDRARDDGFRPTEVREAMSRLVTAESVEVKPSGHGLLVRGKPGEHDAT